MSVFQDSKHFTLDKLNEKPLESPVSVSLPSNLSKDNLLQFPAFRDWLTRVLHNLDLQKNPAHTFHSNPYKLLEIDVQAADWFGSKKLGFVKIQAKVENDRQDSLPGAVFLRGGSVGILVILRSS
jgi:ADP-sugar diphosphatase